MARIENTRTRLPAGITPLLLAAIASFTGCATPAAVPTPTAAVAAPARVADDVSAVRRCVDNLLLDSGMREVSLVVDQVADAARPGDTGAREALVSVLSDMTQRSRTVRVVAPGAAGSTAAAPQYALRGTLRADGSTLGLDLTLLSARDLSVVAGTASHNVVNVIAPAGGAEGRVELRKFGTPFSMAAPTAAAATRALLELGAAETLGRAAKVPYWSCFGAGVNEAGVAAEIQDWYDTLATRPAEIISFFQERLRHRALYDGPVDGAVNPALKEAVSRYREALGLSREAKLSLDFFRAYLGADHARLAERLAPPAPSRPTVATATATAPVAPTAPTAPSALPVAAGNALGLRLATGGDAQRLARGEAVRLSIRPSRDAHVYCFHQNENGRITRFFPNRFQPDSRVPSDTGLQLPGPMRFEIVMNKRGVPEAISCFATERDVLAQLPASVNGNDFDTLPVASLDQVRLAFLKAAGGSLAQESLQLRAK